MIFCYPFLFYLNFWVHIKLQLGVYLIYIRGADAEPLEYSHSFRGGCIAYFSYSFAVLETLFIIVLLFFSAFINPLNLPFRGGYGSIVPRGRQRPQNRCLKHLYKRVEIRIRLVSLLGSFAVYEAFPDLYATILALFR